MYIRSKKALSVVIGYLLIVVLATVIGVIVYQWQKTYVPKDSYAECPEGVSLSIISKSYDCTNGKLTLEIKNTGQFSVGGYFIYLIDDLEKTIATIDASKYHTNKSNNLSEILDKNGVKLGGDPLDASKLKKNTFNPGDGPEKHEYILNILGNPDIKIYGVEIVPIRWQKEGRREVLASCKNQKIKEEFSSVCSEECVVLSESVLCAERECGEILDNCYNYYDCGPCVGNKFCDSRGKCVEEAMP